MGHWCSAADGIWNLYLAGTASNRPFGQLVLDGVDVQSTGGTAHYPAFIQRLWGEPLIHKPRSRILAVQNIHAQPTQNGYRMCLVHEKSHPSPSTRPLPSLPPPPPLSCPFHLFLSIFSPFPNLSVCVRAYVVRVSSLRGVNTMCDTYPSTGNVHVFRRKLAKTVPQTACECLNGGGKAELRLTA